VHDKLNDLAGRAGSRGQSARDYATKVQNQIAKLTAPPPTVAKETPPPVTPPPANKPTTSQPTKQPDVSLVNASHTNLTSPFDGSKLYQQSFLDPGFKIVNHADLSGVGAPAGTRVMVNLEVSPEGDVVKLSRCTLGGQPVCQAVASAPGWKFSSPSINSRPAKAIATVTIQF